MRILVSFLSSIFITVSAFAQEAPKPVEPQKTEQKDTLPAPIFPTGAWFTSSLSTPSNRVELAPIRRLRDFVVGDKLELPLRSYIELVMENNTNIAIQRAVVEIPKDAITRAFAPFDPTLGLSFINQRSIASTTNVLQGADTLNTNTQPGVLSYTQTLAATGVNLSVGYNFLKTSTNDRFASYNPAFNSNLSLQVSQPLLQNRGAYINRLPIMIARGRYQQSLSLLRSQVMVLLANAENAYWDVVQSRENLVLQQKFMELRDAALKRAQRELELGALSPLDIYQPQAEFASSEVAVIQAKYQLLQAEDALRQQIGADLEPDFRSMSISLTEPVTPPADTAVIDKEDSVQRALQMRPDLVAARQSIDIDDLVIKRATNELRPNVALVGGYTAQGRGGNFYPNAGDPTAPPTVIPGGYGDALHQMFTFGFPIYYFGLQLNLPVRNRRAAADVADASVQKKLDALAVRNTVQSVRLDVLRSVNDVESSKASVKQAQIARDFAQKRFEAEQKKYDLGTTVLFFVLDAQTQLNRAENDLLQQEINYRRSLISLYRSTGELLEVRGVTIQ